MANRQCNDCGTRLWLSGFAIGSHERGNAHNRVLLLRRADQLEAQAVADPVTSTNAAGRPDAEWYIEEAARLREIAR